MTPIDLHARRAPADPVHRRGPPRAPHPPPGRRRPRRAARRRRPADLDPDPRARLGAAGPPPAGRARPHAGTSATSPANSASAPSTPSGSSAASPSSAGSTPPRPTTVPSPTTSWPPAPSRRATSTGSTRNWPPATPASAAWSGSRREHLLDRLRVTTCTAHGSTPASAASPGRSATPPGGRSRVAVELPFDANHDVVIATHAHRYLHVDYCCLASLASGGANASDRSPARCSGTTISRRGRDCDPATQRESL